MGSTGMSEMAASLVALGGSCAGYVWLTRRLERSWPAWLPANRLRAGCLGSVVVVVLLVATSFAALSVTSAVVGKFSRPYAEAVEYWVMCLLTVPLGALWYTFANMALSELARLVWRWLRTLFSREHPGSGAVPGRRDRPVRSGMNSADGGGSLLPFWMHPRALRVFLLIFYGGLIPATIAQQRGGDFWPRLLLVGGGAAAGLLVVQGVWFLFKRQIRAAVATGRWAVLQMWFMAVVVVGLLLTIISVRGAPVMRGIPPVAAGYVLGMGSIFYRLWQLSNVPSAPDKSGARRKKP